MTEQDAPANEQGIESPDGPDCIVVGIGASAGGIIALQRFFDGIPSDPGLAFVLVQHLAPDRESALSELLSRRTDMPVLEVEEGMRVLPNRVHVIPPNREMVIRDRGLYLNLRGTSGGVHVPIDIFFRSLGEDCRERAVGIVLSGTGSDGSLGLKAIKAEGGMTIAQDPETAEYEAMPRNAIHTGAVDHILPTDRMPEVLKRYAEHPYVEGGIEGPPAESKARDGVNTVIAIIRARLGYHFGDYKKSTLTRRIQRRMGLRHVDGFDEYVKLLRSEPDELQGLFSDLLIGVTEFLRDSEAWETLEREAIRKLVRDKPNFEPVRAWVPGCATGEEAYSLAMLFHEELRKSDGSSELKVFATDIHDRALQAARAGRYPESIGVQLSAERLRAYFVRSKGDDHYQVGTQLRESVVFAQHNLIADPPFSRLDLIACRNLLIYLEPETQEKVLSLFHFALNDGGYLFLGSAESIGRNDQLFETISKKWRVYRKIGPTRREGVAFPISQGQKIHHNVLMERLREPRGRSALIGRAEDLVLEHYAPGSVLIDHRHQILRFFGPTDRYLAQPTGEPTRDLMVLAREGLQTALRRAVHEATEEGRAVTRAGVHMRRGSSYQSVKVTVTPLGGREEEERLYLVVFEEGSAEPAERPAEVAESPPARPAEEIDDKDALIQQLEHEIKVTKQELRASIEDLETSNEELRASNEEAMSINEELQSANEELESSKEELQSLNEELNTVNAQLQHKLDELEQTHNDLNNLLHSTRLATIFLDIDFNIKFFTPPVRELFNLLPTDIGRPLTDISHRLLGRTLTTEARAVAQTAVPRESEVQARDGRWYIRKILPYRTGDDQTAGVVVTFTDITRRKQAEEELRSFSRMLEQRVAERTTLLRLGHEVAKALNAVEGFESAARAVLSWICEGTRWEMGHVLALPYDESESMASTGSWYTPEDEDFEEFRRSSTEMWFHRGEGLVGRVHETGQPLWIEDLQSERKWRRERHGDARLGSAALFPVLSDRKVVAVLELYSREELPRDEALQALLGSIGIQLGHVYDRERLRVRISDLGIREQQRIGRELHDGIGQQVTGIDMLARSLERDLSKRDDTALEAARRLVRNTERAKAQIRILIRGLMPLQVDAGGIRRALREMAEESRLLFGVECAFTSDPRVAIEDTFTANHLYHIAREALHNAVKHSDSDRVDVSLELENGELVLQVRDSGSGFDPAAHKEGLGIGIMRHRADLIDADLRIESSAGHGATVTCRLPAEHQ